MSVNHPLGPQVRDLCRLYPQQSSAIFQTFLDLNLAQSWTELEPVQLHDNNDDNGREDSEQQQLKAVIFSGKRPSSNEIDYVLPIPLHQPLSLRYLSKIFTLLDQSNLATHKTTQQVQTIFLGIVDKDASVVYYVLKRGIVSPKEVRD
ncbi:hypothetical protein ACM66B_004263 [Microbotryomycetes sp. NB124-2]